MDWCVIGAAVACIVQQQNKKKRRRVWMKSWLANRKYSHLHLINELRLEPDDYRNYLRMTENTYQKLLDLVAPCVRGKDTVMRKAISPHEKLSCTLRFLATGRSIADLKYTANLSQASISHLIPEVCTAICRVLMKEYMKFPSAKEEWENVANGFLQKWNFPHCLGAVDGKHIRITCPPKSGSYYYNYKGFYSIVLMAVVDSDYNFIVANVGTNGRVSDGGVIENTKFYEKLVNNQLDLPLPCTVSENGQTLPFVFVGDEAFFLRSDFLKPYNIKELTYEKKIFNYRLSRARNVVENCFGMLASRFRIFHTEINLKLSTIDRVVLTCCVLHNFLRQQNKRDEIDISLSESICKEINVFGNLQRGHNRRAGEHAKEVRDMFLKYFNEEGQLAWQHERITT